MSDANGRTNREELLARLEAGVPLVRQLREGYGLGHARDDFTAGLTTAVLLVPQATAYAMLAGLPPGVGLLASTLPLFVYAVLGSSAHLSVGPVAMVSIVTYGALSQLATPGSDDYLLYAAELALLTGVLQFALGALRFGFIADLLSHPVMTGFAAAAALLIISTQLGAILGLELEASQQRVDLLVWEVIRRWREIHVPTLGIGLACVVALVILRKGWPRLPRALLVLAAAALVAWLMRPHNQVEMVGDIPGGLPPIAFPEIDGPRLWDLLPTAAVVLLVGFVEAYAVARVTAREVGRNVQPDRELAGLGAANVASALVGAYPVGGAFSRTAVNARAGARTNLAGLVTAAIVVLVLLYMTPAFQHVPRAGLAAIIIVAVSGLIDVQELARFWRLDRRDFALAMLTFAGTLALGVRHGIALGVGTSVALFLMRVARPRIIELGGRVGTRSGNHRPVPASEENPDRQEEEGVLVLRVQAPAFFANARYLQEQILEKLEGKNIHTVVVDAAAMDHLDASAELALSELLEELERRQVVLRIARPTEEALELLERSGLLERLSRRVHDSLSEALSAARGSAPSAS